MGLRRIRFRLQDINESLEAIQQATQGLTYEEYVKNRLVRHAIEREIEIISEASRHIPIELREHAPQIPWKQIADIGNWLRHAYDRIEDRILWNVVQDELPPLREAIHTLLALKLPEDQ